MSLSGAADLNAAALKRADLMNTALGREARTLNMVELGRLLNHVNERLTIDKWEAYLASRSLAAVGDRSAAVAAALPRRA